MNKVIVTNPFHTICGMQVCAVSDATDEEILEICNKENPSGTTNGWSQVIRSIDKNSWYKTKESLPVQCLDDKGRLHFLITC